MAAIAEIRLEEIKAKEDLSLRLGDALDVKASVGLVVLLFLATQSAYFFDKGPSVYGWWMQVVSAGFTSVAILFAIFALWPRRYTLPEPESDIVTERIAQLRHFYASDPTECIEPNVTAALIDDETKWAKERIAANQKKNWLKSDFLNWSFWLTIPAIALNLGTMLALIKN